MIRDIGLSDALPGASLAAFTVQTTFGSSRNQPGVPLDIN